MKKAIYIYYYFVFLSGLPFSQTYDFKINTFTYYDSNLNYNHYARFSNLSTSSSLFSWQVVQTPIFYFITDIFFIDSLYGWATHGNGGILKTTNSGFNWVHTQIVTQGIGPISGVYFINRDTGWICGQSKRIRKTTDNGISWIIQDFPEFDMPSYKSIKFLNNNTGYAIGARLNKAYIVKTTNSGQNWTQLYLSNSAPTDFNGQYWFNNDTGFFYGSSIFLKTTNAGASFIDYYPNIPPTSNGANGLLGLFFINNSTGWLSGSNVDNKNMHKTTNSGLNWFFQDNPVAQYQFPQLNDVIFINENTGWAAAYVGQIITTTNGGANWVTDLSAPNWFSCFTKYSSSKIWCGAHYGEVWYLDNFAPIGIQPNSGNLPVKFNLKQNYPNPFNNQTVIEFDLPIKQSITIRIFDLQGREIDVLCNGIFNAGSYKLNYTADRIASGVYFYTLSSDQYISTKKFILIK